MINLSVIIILVVSTSVFSCLLCIRRMSQGRRTVSPRTLVIDPIVSGRLPALPVTNVRKRFISLRREKVRHFMTSGVDDGDTFDPMGYEFSLSKDAKDSLREDYDCNDGDGEEDSEEGIEKGLQKFMLDSIRWYKSTLSPMMPPNCRFLPTCSSYGLDSIKKFGPIKGGILTAWRILRCTPFGGSGYDAPQWPPPGYRAGSNTKPWF